MTVYFSVSEPLSEGIQAGLTEVFKLIGFMKAQGFESWRALLSHGIISRFAKHPESKKDIVALVATEHLGQIEYRENGDVYEPTGKVEPSFLWTRNDPALIQMAIKAVQEHHWPRVMVQCVERPGIHGGPQGVWYGMGKIALKWDLPAFATMGTQGAYWTTNARIDTFNKQQFCTQVAAMAQLTGELMQAPLK